MKNIKQEAVTWGQLLLLVAIWSLVLFVTNTPLQINLEALKKLPEVVTIYTILVFIFTKWLWRAPQLQGWLVPFPDLQGTWEGTLQTTWVNPNSKKIPPPIPLILVIRQTFDSINCTMYTKESTSFSMAASFTEDLGSGAKTLAYNYSNRPDASIRDRSAVHDGAALLTVVTKPKKELKGEYWTNRKTTGSIGLKFKTKELLESFPNKI
ncbi:hypothetical protein HYW44_01260 [Candidatus Daviesbacteria bacterium]|nr:hypothetical protein [Candidatus Daviesbacteria bacterium]